MPRSVQPRYRVRIALRLGRSTHNRAGLSRQLLRASARLSQDCGRSRFGNRPPPRAEGADRTLLIAAPARPATPSMTALATFTPDSRGVAQHTPMASMCRSNGLQPWQLWGPCRRSRRTHLPAVLPHRMIGPSLRGRSLRAATSPCRCCCRRSPQLPSTAAVVPTESSGQFNASKVTLQVRFRRPFGKNYRLRKQSLTERLQQIVWPSK